MFQTMKDNVVRYFSEFASNFDFISFTSASITLKDVIDILIVAYFIYRIILWIKETRAWSLFKGIIVVLLISSLSFAFGFTTISWIVKTAVNVGIIALIIIFQPELRKALEQLGKGRLSLPFNFIGDADLARLSQNTVDEVIKASFAMAKARTGALILLEMDVKLGDLEQTGIRIDADVSSPLLINIFEDKTPLHDGAVIIRNNRIAAASCILPLTQKEIGKELGTRHRAAVGASELSDCFVIVVSEESGGVSIVSGGKLNKKQSPEELRRQLTSNTDKTERKKKFSFIRGLSDK